MGWISIGALCCAAAVGAGAFGAHALRARLDPEDLARWETAVRYLMYGGFGILLVGLAVRAMPRPGFGVAAGSLLLGSLTFSVTLGALALGGPRWLGAITPVGGGLLILGFLVFAWVAAVRV